MSGMGAHELPNWGQTVEWFTPPWLLSQLGNFDTAPCSPGQKTDSDKWEGCVFLNPPYDKKIGHWLRALADHGNGIALIFARTETRHFFDYVWNRADAILFLKGRLHFYRPNGVEAKANAGAPSCLIAYGAEAVKKLEQANIQGKLIKLEPVRTERDKGA